MNGAVLLVCGVVFFALAYRIYGRYLGRLFGVDADRLTPAHDKRDGLDYVPTKMPILFGHHFASIAGAGPIVGPILALYMGWVPVVLWILIGAVFVGAMHDFAALFVSVRNEGRSIGHVIEGQIGFAGRQMFLLFSWATLVLVVAIFALLVAKTFVAQPAVATASLLFVAIAPVFGYLVYRRGLSIGIGSLVFVPLLFFIVWAGTRIPLDLQAVLSLSQSGARNVWLVILLGYAFVASSMPVWLLLQPRDYLNSFLLYAMMIVGFVGILAAAPEFSMPALTGWAARNPVGEMTHVFPILYVTVACGACSGFHALVSSGTTAKQLNNERNMRAIGYGSMLVEGVLALMAVTSVAVLSRVEYDAFLSPGGAGPVKAFAAGIAGFAGKIGLPVEIGVTFMALAIAAFLLTTLDTATRLTRFAWQELFLPRAGGAVAEPPSGVRRFFGSTIVASLLAVLLAGYLAGSGNAGQIWPVFGASNQLLAALTLLVITLYLLRRKANFWVAFVPMLFMGTITVWALVQLVARYWGGNVALVCAAGFLLALAVVLAVQAALSLRGALGGKKPFKT